MTNGLDILLAALGLLFLILTGLTMIGKRAVREMIPFGLGSLGVFIIGVAGLSDLPALFVAGAVLLAGALWYEWRSQRAKTN